MSGAAVEAYGGGLYQVGDRICVWKEISLLPYGYIEIGERGTVVFIDQTTHYTEILMDNYLECLREWRNHLWLIPPDTDEISDAIKHDTSRNKPEALCLLSVA